MLLLQHLPGVPTASLTFSVEAVKWSICGLFSIISPFFLSRFIINNDNQIHFAEAIPIAILIIRLDGVLEKIIIIKQSSSDHSVSGQCMFLSYSVCEIWNWNCRISVRASIYGTRIQ